MEKGEFVRALNAWDGSDEAALEVRDMFSGYILSLPFDSLELERINTMADIPRVLRGVTVTVETIEAIKVAAERAHVDKLKRRIAEDPTRQSIKHYIWITDTQRKYNIDGGWEQMAVDLFPDRPDLVPIFEDLHYWQKVADEKEAAPKRVKTTQ